jgi:hypothetical protein
MRAGLQMRVDWQVLGKEAKPLEGKVTFGT